VAAYRASFGIISLVPLSDTPRALDQRVHHARATRALHELAEPQQTHTTELSGLADVAQGRYARPFYGWTTERHWIFDHLPPTP